MIIVKYVQNKKEFLCKQAIPFFYACGYNTVKG